MTGMTWMVKRTTVLLLCVFAIALSGCPSTKGKGGAGEDGTTWQSSLRLRFGALGEVAARVVLAGDQLHIRLDAPDAGIKGLLDAHQARLAQALDAAGTPLVTLAIHDHGQG